MNHVPANDTAPGQSNPSEERSSIFWLALGALGVVYGDIGTSPLYAIKECFIPVHGVEPVRANVLGVLSLVFWTLMLVVVIKYLTFVMRADNRGEGGIMALLALLLSHSQPQSRSWKYVLVFGLFGSSLLWADGMITPAITVLSAIEGLEVATPLFRPVVVPVTLIILFGLFLVQKRGTGDIGAVFGPAMFVWFFTIGLLGLPWIWKEPGVLAAVNPYYAAAFFVHNQGHGFLLLGAVVLCITGSEALYADMGHFGVAPIRRAWYAVVFPGLLMNYFGQGSVILARGAEAAVNPFYMLSPGWMLYPLVVLATVASIIASQALISGAFSLAQQAMQLGYSPRWTVIHTSGKTRGQIYVPEINSMLMIACLGLVLAFQKSTNLAAAYGLAVAGTMAITSFLMFFVMTGQWGWQLWKALLLTGIFLTVDLMFVLANTNKIGHGGWFPMLVGGGIYVIMTTWKAGQTAVGEKIRADSISLELFMEDVAQTKLPRVRGTAVFLTSNADLAPLVLLHHVKHNKVLHEKVVLLSLRTENVPKVNLRDHIEIKELGHGFYLVTAAYGFMQSPHVPWMLRNCLSKGLEDIKDASYYLGRVTVVTARKPTAFPAWRKWIFIFLYRNARPATAFFHITPNRVIELGMQIEL
ncbi:MAG: potassium transporter Kup [bacterium]